jgi:hypothetical protein
VTATQAKRKLSAAVEKVGGTLEEDTGFRTIRVFQCCAPFGRVWRNGTKHVRVEIDSVLTDRGGAFNADGVVFALGEISCGHDAMTAQERFDCDEEGSK